MLAHRGEVTEARAEPQLGLPGDGANLLWHVLLALEEVATDRGRVVVRPRRLAEHAADMRVAALGDPPLAPSLASGILRRDHADEVHEVLRTEAGEIAELRDHRDGDNEREAAQGLEGLDDWEKKTGTVDADVVCSTPLWLCSDPHNLNNVYQWCDDANDNHICDNKGLYSDAPPDGGVFEDFLAHTNGELCSYDCPGLEGYTDWRVPTLAELNTIVDFSAPGCKTGGPCINPIFGPTLADDYWSATTNSDEPARGFGVNFSNGQNFWVSKTAALHVRAVRGGCGRVCDHVWGF